MNTAPPMSPNDKVMLICGIVLFVAGLATLFYCLKKSKSSLPAIPILLIAVGMIGYPTIKSLTLPGGGGFEKNVQEFVSNPNDVSKRAIVAAEIEKLPTSPDNLSPDSKSNLEAVVSGLSNKTNLSLASRLVLSKAQLALGRTNDAAINVQMVHRVDTNLVVDPRLRTLITRPIH